MLGHAAQRRGVRGRQARLLRQRQQVGAQVHQELDAWGREGFRVSEGGRKGGRLGNAAGEVRARAASPPCTCEMGRKSCVYSGRAALATRSAARYAASP